MTDTTTTSPNEIFFLLGEAKRKLGPIGKGGFNNQQQFAFRGIEDVIAGLGPILDELGIIIVPNVVERVAQVRTSKNGATMYEVSLKVEFTLLAPDGSWVRGSAWGEGVDSLDKATNKAHTGAYKNFLTETFNIRSKDLADSDPDRGSQTNTDGATGEASEPISCPVCEESGGHWEHVDMEKFRDHMVTKHQWVRLDDGRVSRPKARTGDPATDPNKGYPDHVERPMDPPKVDEDEETRDTEEALTPDAIKAMDKKTVVGHLAERKLATSGSLDTLRTRLLSAVVAAPKDKAPSESTGTAKSDASAPASEPDAATSSASSSSTGDDDEGEDIWECPEDGCDALPFTSEADYTAHWNAVHGSADSSGGDAPAEPAADDSDTPAGESEDGDADDPPLDAENVVEVKRLVGELKGEKARAYAKYRRQNKLGKPEDLHLTEGLDLLEFLYELADA